MDAQQTVILKDCPACHARGFLFSNGSVMPDEETLMDESLEMTRCPECDGRGRVTPGHALRLLLAPIVEEFGAEAVARAVEQR